MAHIHADGSEEFEKRRNELAAENYRAAEICRRKDNNPRDLGARGDVHIHHAHQE